MSEVPRPSDREAQSTLQSAATQSGAAVPVPPRREPGPPTLPFPTELGPHPPAAAGYELLSLLGQGSMGVVYLGRQKNLNRLVALKVFYASSSQAARFYAEAQLLAAVQHPGVVPVYELGEAAGVPYLALEYCAGGNLADRLQGQPQPPRQAAAWCETLARTMAAAHQARIIHRDLKPANILLAADGQLKIADFGLAKKLDTTGPTATGAILGTPSYMAPEQADGQSKEIGPAADVYALGAILYEMLAGRPPFQGTSALATLQRVVRDEPPPLRQLRPDVPRDLETICLHAMDKEPRRRYASAAALADDLARFLRGEPVAAQRLRWAARLGRWLRQPERIRQAAEYTIFHALVRAGVALVIVASYLFKMSLAPLPLENWFDMLFSGGLCLGLFWAGWRTRDRDPIALAAGLALTLTYLGTRLPFLWKSILDDAKTRLDEPFTLLSPVLLYTLLATIQLAASGTALWAWWAQHDGAQP